MSGNEARRFWLAYVCSLAASAAFAASGLQDDGYVRQSQFDVLRYDLACSLSDTSNVLIGEARLTLRARGEITAPHLRLDLKAMAVNRVEVAHVPALFQQTDTAVYLDLPQSLAAHDTFEVTVAYAGVPQDGLIIGNNKFGQRIFFADNWPNRAQYWFPSLDHPSDKSAVTLRVTLPAHYTVIANGTLVHVRETSAGYKTWQWSEPVPIPTYCIVFGAADFSVITPNNAAAVPLSYYAYAQDAPYVVKNFGRVREMLAFFSERIGPFPFSKLALVQSTTRYGGMENASAIFFAEKSLGRGKNFEATAAHEIAHQWFGDSVTEADWHHLWLSEGFATYGEALFFEHVEGSAQFRENMREKRAGYFAYAARADGPILDYTITDYMALLSPNNYAKAAWVLHMLRAAVGEEAFWRGLREYYARFKHANVSTQDFRAVMEEVSGASLQWFFQQWLEGRGYPRVEAKWHWQPRERQVVLRLRQTQSGTFFRVPIEVALRHGSNRVAQQIIMTEREQTFLLAAASAPQEILFDPEVKLLMAVAVVKE